MGRGDGDPPGRIRAGGRRVPGWLTPARALIALLMASVAALSAGITGVADGLGPAISATGAFSVPARWAPPGPAAVRLPAGTWDLEVDVGGWPGAAFANPAAFSSVLERRGSARGVSAGDVEVLGPAGTVPVRAPQAVALQPGPGATADAAPDAYRPVAEFRTPTGGTYVVTVRRARPGTVVAVAANPFAAVSRWAALAIAGGLGVILAVVLLILQLDRRRRDHGAVRRPAAWGPPAPPAAGRSA